MKYFICLLLLIQFIASPSRAQEWKTLYDSAKKRFDSRDFRTAIDLLGKAQTQAEKEFGKLDSAYALSTYYLGHANFYLSRIDQAEILMKESYDIRKELFGEEHSDVALNKSDLAMMYYITARFAKAESLYKEVLPVLKKDISSETGYRYYTNTFNNLANMYVVTGRLYEAEKMFNELLAFIKETKGYQHPRFASCLAQLAIIYETVGRYGESEKLLLQAIDIHKETIGDKDHLYAHYLSRLGLLNLNRGRIEEAENLLLKSLRIIKEKFGQNHKLTISHRQALAEFYQNTGRYFQAEKLLLEALDIGEKTYGNLNFQGVTKLIKLAQIYHYTSRYAEAEKTLNEALLISREKLGNDHPDTKRAEKNLAKLRYQANRKDLAIPTFQALLEYYQEYVNNYFEYTAENERDAFYKTVKDYFELYADLTSKEYSDSPQLLSDLYNLQLRNKALLLNTSNQMKNRIMGSGDRKLIALYDEVQAIKQLLGQTSSLSNAELVKQRDIKRDSLQQVLRTKDQQLMQLSTFYAVDTKRPTWKDVQAKLKKKEAAVEMVRFRSYDFKLGKFTDQIRYAALIITSKTKTQPKLVLFENGTFLENQAISYYRNKIQFQLEDEQSYQHFWKPLNKALKTMEKVYFSPDGVFHSLNLNTLQNPETKQFLVQELEVHLLTSGKDLLTEKREVLPQKLGVLVGNPDFGSLTENNEKESPDYTSFLVSLERGSGIRSLPGAEQEVLTIQTLLRDNNWRDLTLINDAAREEAIKDMLKPNILHFATHGFFQEDVGNDVSYNKNPMFRSGLLLSGAAESLATQEDLRGNIQTGKEDGILTAFEVMNLNIDNTDLVVLSACETGLGEIRNGEGVYGLQRAFKVAGARSILMSLWKVNDQTTQKLMVSFVSYWLSGVPKRTALKKAQEQLMADHTHPYYWGAFVLIGE